MYSYVLKLQKIHAIIDRFVSGTFYHTRPKRDTIISVSDGYLFRKRKDYAYEITAASELYEKSH